ncbi:MAG: hypothetical protein OXF66_02135 [Gammaproteobacteria bacterium]|nr:hypothetical protein [Gammaproteobacteria bacterium]
MTEDQKVLRDLNQDLKELRGEQLSLASKDLTDESKARLQAIAGEMKDLEFRAGIIEDAIKRDDQAQTIHVGGHDAETRERIELRGRASVAGFIRARMQGRIAGGAEAEFTVAVAGKERADAILNDGAIPLEFFEPVASRGIEERAVTPSPATVGVNMQPIAPAIFAMSSAMTHLHVGMPSAESGTFAQARISTSVTAEAKAKSAAVPQTAGALSVTTTVPHRVGGSVQFTLEDLAAVGVSNFESAFRENLQIALGAELDRLLLEGDSDAAAAEPSGFLDLIAAPTATVPASGTAGFGDGVAMYFAQVDGVFATEVKHVKLLTGIAAYRLLGAAFRSDEDSMTFSDWAESNTMGLRGTPRLDDNDELSSKGSPGLFYKGGMAGVPSPMTTAICPTWGQVMIEDIYTGATKGQRSATMSVMVGDLIIVQPAAYSRVSIRTTS